MQHRLYKSIIFIILFVSTSFGVEAAVIQGTLTDTTGYPLAYANIYIKNTTYGVTSDLKGRYYLETKAGEHTLVFSFIGYEKHEEIVSVSQGQRITLNIELKPSPTSLQSFDVVTKYEDRSGEILRKVRERKKHFTQALNDYKCETYIKTSLEKEKQIVQINIDEPSDDQDIFGKKEIDFETKIKKDQLNLLESISTTYFKKPRQYKEDISAQHDFVEKRGNIGSRSVGVGLSYGEQDIAPTSFQKSNPYILFEDLSSCDFNFYKNLIDFPALCQKPLLSPIAATGNLSYRYSIEESFYEDSIKVYKIKVDPILKSEALFYGYIFIEDESWILRSVDLHVNKRAMNLCKSFKIIQNYEVGEDGIPLAVRRELTYTFKEGKNMILGNTRVNHKNYIINSGLKNIRFNSEIKTFAVEAFDRDSTYWTEMRPLTLKEAELDYIHEVDSLEAWYTSPEYYAKIDSAFNKLSWWIPLSGYGHRNRARGTEFYIEGLFSQVQPFAVGGYAHKLPGYFNKEFRNNFLLETRGHVSYGFKNKDLKGKVGVGLTYVPLKFVRTFIEVGDYYDQVNNYASIEQAFSRSNYVRSKTFKISQRMEIINGLFGELSFDYSDQDPISDLQLAEWSEILFGEQNNPIDFVRYKKSEIKLELKYRLKQKYVIKKNKKIIIGTEYPEFRFIYRKGIPTLFDSEVNFDYLEINGSYDMTLSRFGTSFWSFNLGGYLNKKNLRLLEYKYFRGSDRYFFSSPVYSFQLLDVGIISTPNEYLRANYIHHFEGTLLNKVPLINRLKLGVAAGAGTLMIPEDSFSHFEMFAGLERVFKIEKQLFRFGVYAVTADNTLSNADFTIKFGIDFFNSYTNKWNY